MRPESKKLLWDAREAAARVERFTAGTNFADYLRNPMVSSAVERQLEILGEALNRLARLDPECATGIPELPKIVGLRNILAHGYDSVDHELVWDIVMTKLPRLAAEIETLLNQG